MPTSERDFNQLDTALAGKVLTEGDADWTRLARPST